MRMISFDFLLNGMEPGVQVQKGATGRAVSCADLQMQIMHRGRPPVALGGQHSGKAGSAADGPVLAGVALVLPLPVLLRVTFGVRAVLLDGDEEGGAAEPNAVAVVQRAGRRVGRRLLRRARARPAPADRLPVDERAVAATE